MTSEGDDIDKGPEPSEIHMPDWVPADLRQPERRDELLRAIGVSDKPEHEERPEWLPEKFWDAENGKARTDAMAKSYSELEKKLGTKAEEVPDKYEVKLPDGFEIPDGADALSEKDAEVFKELGLTNNQAQKLVEHFWETVAPEFAKREAEVEHQKLVQAWGFDSAEQKEYLQRLGAINEWAQKNLPEEAFNSLKSSSQGVKSLYAMMQANAAPANQSSGYSGRTITELQDIMNSDEYWRDGNDGLRASVQRELESRLGKIA